MLEPALAAGTDFDFARRQPGPAFATMPRTRHRAADDDQQDAENQADGEKEKTKRQAEQLHHAALTGKLRFSFDFWLLIFHK